MTIEYIKKNARYKYRFIDLKQGVEVYGYIYDLFCLQYFVNDNETYFYKYTNN